MKTYCCILLLLICCQFNIQAQASPIVIELFTSQGCSSCPPADALLEEIANMYPEDVIVLSYHVDYWDYIGWKDPFASSVYTKKQYAYGAQFGSRSVYTPQAIVQGDIHFTGSDRSKMLNAVEHYNKKAKTQVKTSILALDANSKTVTVATAFQNLPKIGKRVYVLAVKNKVTSVRRGENKNRQLHNTHVVAGIQEFPLSTTVSPIDIPIADWALGEETLEVVVYVSDANGRIISAARNEVSMH